jgi:hypothetical protein
MDHVQQRWRRPDPQAVQRPVENFCWPWQVLEGSSAHVDSGQPLPRELFDKLVAA